MTESNTSGCGEDTATLVSHLRDRDEACPLCNYNLRGLRSSNCPECGTKLVLSVQQAEPYLRAWLLMTVLLCLNAGMGLLILCITIRDSHFPETLLRPVILPATIVVQLSIPLTALVIVKRRWFLRQTRSRQWWLSGVVSAIAAAAMLQFFAFIR